MAAPLLLAGLLGVSSAPAASLTVRASDAAAPCAAAAAEAYARTTGRSVSVEAGVVTAPAPVDVTVAFDVEMTRVVEGGLAVDGSEKDVARVPWVLAVPAGNPAGIRGLDDIKRAAEVWVLGGPAAHEARRAAAALAEGRLHESTDAATLRQANVALVPLSIAGRGERIAVDVRPLVAEAAVAAQSVRPDEARDFVAFLASEAGQKAFAACGQQ